MSVQREFEELLAFISSSAMGCINEPHIYGPLRLVDSLARLIVFSKHAGIADDLGLDSIAKRIEQDKNLCMTDEEAFCIMIQDIALNVVDYINQ